MAITIILPSTFKIGALYHFCDQFVTPEGEPKDGEITFDFGYLNFIDGVGLTVLTNTLDWLFNRSVKCFFSNHNVNRSNAIFYLDSCGFFENYLGQKVSIFSRVKSTTIPCSRVRHSEGPGWLDFKLSPWLCPIVNVPDRKLYSLKVCVKEIFNNIRDHSTEDIGCVHVQHYPNIKQIGITISDFGRGIPSSMRSRYGDLRDDVAIWKAAQEGVTAKTTPNNRGVGLDYLITTVLSNGGRVGIYSFSGSLLAAPYQERQAHLGNGSYPGTLVDIALPTHAFVGDDDEEEDMQW